MDDAALAWAAARLGHPLLEVRPLLGGQTSTMLALTDESGSRSVLRLLTQEPWRTHGAGLAARESQVQQQLVETSLPVPRSIALDADGVHCGVAAHLMSLLPGSVDTTRVADDDLARLADVLADVHDVRADPAPRTYQPWAFEAKYVVPTWSRRPHAWERAFDVLRGDPPDHAATFLHRDFHLRNVLWLGSEISGVVDWVETSTGPADLDVAHCCTNLAVDHGSETAGRFRSAYVARTGRTLDPWWDVLDVVGFLPVPRAADFTADPHRLARLDDHLALVLAGLDG